MSTKPMKAFKWITYCAICTVAALLIAIAPALAGITLNGVNQANGAVAAHAAAADPHTGYMLESNIGTGANNYLQLGATPGTPDGTKFLRDDGTWAAASGWDKILEDGNGAAPTTDGYIKYDRTTERLQVGTGAATSEFYAGAHTVVDDSPSDGNTTEAASSNSVYDHGALTLLPHGIADTSKLTTNAAAITDNAVCRGDGGANGVQKSGILVNDADLMTFPATAGAGIFLPEENDAATPTLSFGAGEGIYSVGDALFFSIAGVQKIVFSGTKFQMAVTDGPQLSISGSTATAPNILPDYIDTDTGIGHDGSGNTDKLSLIAGGKEVERLIEDTYTAKQLMPSTGNTHGGYITRIFASTSGTLTGATDSIPLAIPAGWRITQCQLHVKTIVVDSAGDDTWSSELNDGAQEEIISAGSAAAANTNVNHWADADAWGTYADAETNILLTPNGGEFSSGEIEAHCLAYGFDNWDNE